MKYNRNNKSISGRLHDELVMMNIEQGKYFSLNPVATRIWDLLENPLSLEELVQPLLDEYDVDESQCREDVQNYLEEMKKLGLIFSEGV
jgi:hypothetical protein